MYSNMIALTAPLIFLLVCILLHVLLCRVCVPMTFNMDDLFIHNPLDQYIYIFIYKKNNYTIRRYKE